MMLRQRQSSGTMQCFLLSGHCFKTNTLLQRFLKLLKMVLWYKLINTHMHAGLRTSTFFTNLCVS